MVESIEMLNNSARRKFFSWIVVISLSLVLPVTYAQKYVLSAGQSEVIIQVHKGGRLKALGHNHIISTREVSGEIIWNEKSPQKSRFNIVVPVVSLEVDNPELRKQAGKKFEKEVSISARKGTKKNMLGKKILDVVHFPKIIVRNKLISEISPSNYEVTIALEILGLTKEFSLPVIINHANNRIVVKGEFSLLQSDFSIKPLSVAFGSIVVKDRIDIRFQLVANKMVLIKSGCNHERPDK